MRQQAKLWTDKSYLQRRTTHTTSLSLNHSFNKANTPSSGSIVINALWVGRTEDKGVVPRINRRCDEGCSLGVGTSDYQGACMHDIELQTHSDKSVDVLCKNEVV
jgi:hypothetical protein